MNVWSIVVAAGDGSRFGGPKQLAPLHGRRVIDWSLERVAEVSSGVVLVVSEALRSELRREDLPGDPHIVLGGETRSASVRAGLAAVPSDAQVIVVHDGARPLASARLFGRVISAVSDGASAAVTAVVIVDTVRDVERGTIDRDTLRAVQTPQAFWAEALRQAHATEGEATDDASMVEAAGGRVVLVDGSPENLKITHPVDLAVAEAIMAFHEARAEEPEDVDG